MAEILADGVHQFVLQRIRRSTNRRNIMQPSGLDPFQPEQLVAYM
jgi:hypothetical protein